MRNLRLVAALAVAGLLSQVAGQAEAGYISGLYSTGNDYTGTTVAGGTVDANYKFVPTSGTSTAAYVTAPNSYPIPPWAADSAVGTTGGSMWISSNPAPGNNDPVGPYTYTTSFTNSGDTNSFITGSIAADDSVTFSLNGGATQTISGFNSLQSFSFTSGFVVGNNVITFVVSNSAISPQGLRVQIASFSVPEPASLAMVGLGLGLAGIAAVRRRKVATV